MFCKSRSVASDWDFAIMGANWSSLGYGGGGILRLALAYWGQNFYLRNTKKTAAIRHKKAAKWFH